MLERETGEPLIEQVHHHTHHVTSSSSSDVMMMHGRGQGGHEMVMMGNGNGNGSGSSSSRQSNPKPTVLSYERALMKGQGLAAQGQGLAAQGQGLAAQGQGLAPGQAPGPGLSPAQQEQKENNRIAKLLLKKQAKLKERKEKVAAAKLKKREVQPYSHLYTTHACDH